MSLYSLKNKVVLDEMFEPFPVYKIRQNCFIREGEFIKTQHNQYITYQNEQFSLTEDKSQAIEIDLEDDYIPCFKSMFITALEGKLYLSFEPDLIFVNDLDELYISNKIGFVNNGFSESNKLILETDLDILLDSINCKFYKNQKINLKNNCIDDLVLIGNSNLHQKTVSNGRFFEWWFESLTNVYGERINTDTFSKLTNNETLSMVWNCKDSMLLDQLISGMRDPNFLNEKRESALMIALNNNLTNTINHLVSTEINLENVSNEGYTALNYAIMKKNPEIVKKLANDTDIYLGKNNLELAILSNDYEIFTEIFTKIKDDYKTIDENLINKVYEYSIPLIAVEVISYYEEIPDIYEHLSIDRDEYEENDIIPLLDNVEDKEELIITCVFGMNNILLRHLVEKKEDFNFKYKGYPIERFVTDPSLIVKIIEIKTGLNLENEVSIYSEDKFTLVEEISQGGFGKITLEKNNVDNKQYIIKKSISCQDNKLFDETFAKEFLFMKKINENFYKQTAEVYGLMLSKDKSCISIVLENLGDNFSYYIFSAYRDDLELKFKEFFRKLLQDLERLHSLGIRHDDLHPGNVLVENDVPKIIDYGISNFYEVFGLKKNSFPWNDRPQIPVDGISYKKFQDHFASKYINFNQLGKKDYTSDVYAVGQLMCYWVLRQYLNSYFFSHEGKIYITSTKKDGSGDHFDLTDVFEEDLRPLLAGMLELDSNKRLSVTEVLNHQYFSGRNDLKSNFVEHGLNLKVPAYEITKKVDMDNLERMFNNYKSCSVKMNKKLPYNKRVFVKDKYRSLNSVYNSIFVQFESFSGYDDNNAPLMLSTCYFDLINHNSQNPVDQERAISDLVNKKLDFKPVTLFFFYIILKYKMTRLGNEELFDLFDKYFCFFLESVNFEFNIWNVVSVIFYFLTYGRIDPQIGNLDLQNYEKISQYLY